MCEELFSGGGRGKSCVVEKVEVRCIVDNAGVFRRAQSEGCEERRWQGTNGERIGGVYGGWLGVDVVAWRV